LCGHPNAEPDLTDAGTVEAFFRRYQPRYVFHAGGRAGGINANAKYPADLCDDNLRATVNVIRAAHRHGVAKLLYLASSCTYPRLCRQPMREADLWGGFLEPTNQAYAAAKLAGIALCQAYRQQYGSDFIVGIATNCFGIGDDFSLEDSHVVAALIRRFHEAKRRGDRLVVVWGSGTPRREFLFADDLAEACILVMQKYSDRDPINLGGGQDVSIRELAETIRRVVGFSGELEFDTSQPDGMPFKSLDASKLLSLGWRPRVAFEDALVQTYKAFLETSETTTCAGEASSLRTKRGADP
jgi:GDP-L-fucose synthase